MFSEKRGVRFEHKEPDKTKLGLISSFWAATSSNYPEEQKEEEKDEEKSVAERVSPPSVLSQKVPKQRKCPLRCWRRRRQQLENPEGVMPSTASEGQSVQLESKIKPSPGISETEESSENKSTHAKKIPKGILKGESRSEIFSTPSKISQHSGNSISQDTFLLESKDSIELRKDLMRKLKMRNVKNKCCGSCIETTKVKCATLEEVDTRARMQESTNGVDQARSSLFSCFRCRKSESHP